MIVQLPRPVSVTVAPLIVHWPLALKLIGRPAELVALIANGELLSARSGSAPKAIAWLPWATVKLCVTLAAAV